MISVAIVSPKRSLEPINKVIESYDFGCEFHKYIYNELSDIDWIYEDCKDRCDVIFFSGELGYHYIHNHIPNIAIPCAFTAYGTKDILGILLNFCIEHPEIPLNRVFVDFLTPLNHFMDVQRYIDPQNMPYFYEDKIYDYKRITARTQELWDAGKIDLVISRSINNLKALDELKIPYLAVFPSAIMIQESIEAAVKELRLSQAEEMDHLVVILRLPMERSCNGEEREYREATLHKLLVDFRRDNNMDFLITAGFGRFELQTQAPIQTISVERIQRLVRYLQEHLNFPFRIGAGLNPSGDRSHYYAEVALLEALKYGGNDGFLVSGDNAEMTGPLSATHAVTYSYENQNAVSFAKTCGINQTNLLKLVGLFQLNESAHLTAASVGKLLNVTSRSANRILQQLLEAQLIHEISVSGPNKKGRPTRTYGFSAESFRKRLL